MKIKSMTKYIMTNFLMGYVVYAAIVVAVIIISRIIGDMENSMFGGMDSGSAICLGVIAIVFFREKFLFSSQNGVSRKCFILSNLTAFVILAVICSAGDTIISVFGNFVQTHGGAIYESTYEQQFIEITTDSQSNYIATIPEAADYLKGFILMFAIDLTSMIAGFTVSSFIYRLSKTLKIIIIITIIVLCNISPIIFYLIGEYTKYDISKPIKELYDYFTWIAGDLCRFESFFIIISAVLFGISFLIIRRAPIRDRKE